MENYSEQERATALATILDNFERIGLDAAISKFGGPLTEDERGRLKAVAPSELQALKAIEEKLGPLAQLRLSTNNNNNRSICS